MFLDQRIRFSTNSQNKWNKWMLSQIATMETGNEIMPPWVMFRGEDVGWRQGYQEAWLHEVWLPFWWRLLPGEREIYINKWNIPAYWRARISNYTK
jgi:hypothetical protein